MKNFRFIAFSLVAFTTWMVLPAVTMACERCFGAGSDSPIVSAIGVSMLGLLVMIGFVFGGIARFFNQANNRARSLADAAAESSSDQTN